MPSTGKLSHGSIDRYSCPLGCVLVSGFALNWLFRPGLYVGHGLEASCDHRSSGTISSWDGRTKSRLLCASCLAKLDEIDLIRLIDGDLSHRIHSVDRTVT